ncbi:MAG: NYN domain-containing protein [Deltaproteobacteria bacterium]|nr:NYN domain-containing protein [Deltaproteobacteria bacterium]
MVLIKDSAAAIDQLAVLIDADNAQPSVLPNLMQEVASFGLAIVRRIYGDFSEQKGCHWRQYLQPLAIKPIQQFAYTKGKNATDSSLIIDAMDLLYTLPLDGFCLVTSDSDFTGLAIRLRESGKKVYGFGEEKTPQSFRSACNKFILTELLRDNALPKDSKRPKDSRGPEEEGGPEESNNHAGVPNILTELGPDSNLPVKNPNLPVNLFLWAVEKTAHDDGWVLLSEFGSYINQIKPDFDSRKYGYKKLSDLVTNETGLFKVEKRKLGDSGNYNIYLRLCDLKLKAPKAK